MNTALAFRSAGLVLLALMAGCLRARSEDDGKLPVDLGSEDVWVYATHPELPLSAAAIREMAAEVLQASGSLKMSPPGIRLNAGQVGTLSVRTEVSEGDAVPELQVRLRLHLPSRGQWETRGVVSEVSASGLRKAMDAAFAEALWLSEAPFMEVSELVAALDSGKVERRRLALTLLASRREPAALEPLLEELRLGCESSTAAAALPGLVALGDASVVAPLVEVLERCSDPVFLLEAVFALGTLGGPLAEAYLFMMAEGHGDERLRAAARQSLELLARRPAGEEKR